MIIKIIPENDNEKNIVQEVEHKGVKEFFIFGNKKDSDGDMLDFHDWHGSYRFLIGSLAYFSTLVADERRTKENPSTEQRVRIMPSEGGGKPHMIKYGDNDIQVERQPPPIIDISPTATMEGKLPIGAKTSAEDPTADVEDRSDLHLI